MKLKSLEIRGFKSFPDKTIVNFDNDITGIVGPNGCGKSNIIDAIRWVIGEQKIASLRSENLESLVFNGSKSRAASGFAEVTITFENTKNLLPTEFNTVAITRKYYKTGDSEYRLNDVLCRRKDILNLFLDTGIGTDSYSIIELGMVNDLIEDKDNSRRKLLEQAAGITIYKVRKKEAKQKLDATEIDLSRIEDLLHEITEQLNKVETEAKKTEKYLALKKEYQQHTINYAHKYTSTFSQNMNDLEQQLNNVQDNNAKLDANINAHNSKLENLHLTNLEQEQKLQFIQKQYNELIHRISQIENNKNLNKQQLDHTKERMDNIQSLIKQTEAKLKQLYEGLDLNKKQILEQDIEVKNCDRNTFVQKEKLENTRNILTIKKEKLENTRNENKKWETQRYELERKIAVTDTSIENLNNTLIQIEKERELRKEKITQQQKQKQNVTTELNENINNINLLKEQNNQIKHTILDSQKELENLRENLTKENRFLDSKKNEYDLLKSIIDKMEGYPDSVKFLFNNPNWTNKKIPVLSDVITVKEDYNIPIEIFLEPYLNSYIVDTRTEALIAVDLLFTNQKGKSNFFILDEITPTKKALDLNTPELISCISIMDIEEKYNPLLNNLLHNVYISKIDHIDFTKYPQEAIIIDKNGKAVYQHNIIRGGSISLFEGNRIGRLQNLEKIKNVIAGQTEKIKTLHEQTKKLHEYVLYQNTILKEKEIETLQNKINRLENEKYTVTHNLDNLLIAEQSDLTKQEELKKTKTQHEESLFFNKNALDKIKYDYEQTRDLVQKSVDEYDKLALEFSTLQELYNQTNLTFTQKQNYLNNLKQEQKFKLEQIKTEENNLKSNQQEQETSRLKIEDINSKSQEIENEIITLYKKKETEATQISVEETIHNKSKLEIIELGNTTKELYKTKELGEKKHTDLKDKINDIQLKLTSVKERLRIEFNIDLESILNATEELSINESVEELQNLMEKTKRKIEQLGEVNTTAIEAFKEIKNRYETMLAQRNDILSAKENLLQTIQEVETTANQKFLETFNQVNENFKNVFKSLFTIEDECDLMLENPENLSETGVNILAKPKGKRPSNITQLSGGEKTLTATALLFAIYLIKPAPFCILDEVDAPLDDNNVIKFTNMIKIYSESSQFIIVTHNKATMGAVDAIYGVTMQEQGVSKLVAVDFKSLEKEAS